MKLFLLWFVWMAADGSKLKKPEPEVFHGSFNESFSYTAPMTVVHNPHGEATSVKLLWEERLVGVLTIRSSPAMADEAAEKEFAEAGLKYLENRFEATDVKHEQLKNSGGLDFHRLEGKFEKDGKRWLVREAIFFDKREGGAEGQAFLRNAFGTYQFEFVFTEEEAAKVGPALDAVQDSFHLPVLKQAKDAAPAESD